MDRRRKLTEEQVREIRERLEHETCMALALEFRVNHGTISDIKRCETWKSQGRVVTRRSAKLEASLEHLRKVYRRNGGSHGRA